MKKYLRISTLTFAAFGLALTVSATAEAQSVMVACANTFNGSVVVRKRCARNERPVKIGDLSAQGPVGARGEMGPQGLKGDTGAQGPAGAKGDTGTHGLQGIAGPQGAVGAVGPVGPHGAAGPMGPQGAQGPQGPLGPQGPQGLQGIRGESAFDNIPSGRTIRGVVSADYYSSDANKLWSSAVSLPAPAPVAFGNELTVIKNNTVVDNDCSGGPCLHSEELFYTNNCTGTFENPTASPGWICVYPQGASNADEIRGLAMPAGSSRYGFLVRWKNPSAGATHFRGVWAYTAP